jgi:hypothetical protein
MTELGNIRPLRDIPNAQITGRGVVMAMRSAKQRNRLRRFLKRQFSDLPWIFRKPGYNFPSNPKENEFCINQPQQTQL